MNETITLIPYTNSSEIPNGSKLLIKFTNGEYFICKNDKVFIHHFKNLITHYAILE